MNNEEFFEGIKGKYKTNKLRKRKTFFCLNKFCMHEYDFYVRNNSFVFMSLKKLFTLVDNESAHEYCRFDASFVVPPNF